MAQGKRTPTKVKELNGTLDSRFTLKNEMQVPNAKVSKTPEGLVNSYAQNEWLKVTGVLSGIGMLAETDTSLLMAYCNEMGIYFDCMNHIKKSGYTTESKSNGEILSNYIKVGNQALQNAIKIGDKFGFNPAARTKISMGKKDESDIFDELD